MIRKRWDEYRIRKKRVYERRKRFKEKKYAAKKLAKRRHQGEKESGKMLRVFISLSIFSKFIKWIKVILVFITILLGFLAALIYESSHWVLNTWANLNIDEMIFHLKVPIEGTSSDLIADYFNMCVASAIIALFAIILIFIGVKNSPGFRKATVFMILIASGLTIFTSVNLMWHELNVGDYIENQASNSLFIQNNYVDPRSVDISFPEQKRNLIYIFVESMETTYMDKENGGAYDDDYIPELTELARNNINFSSTDKLNGAFATTGTTWTMGGMFAQTSALPLKIPVDGNAMDAQDEFLPDIVTLGDLLNKGGYQQELFIGSDAAFGGRKNYFEQHGDYEIFDYNTAISKDYIPDDYKVWWGFEDEKLFGFAQNELIELAGSEQPFNFTMLTADSHFEDGYVCQSCGDEYGDNQYANVLACSSRKIAKFVTWIQEQEFYNNTTIVIAGDHLTMDSDFCEEVDDTYVRSVYNTIINPASPLKRSLERKYTTMDLFPTTLASMGVSIEGNKLGLGTNLFSEEETLVEKYGLEKMNNELDKKSGFFSNFTKGVKVEE